MTSSRAGCRGPSPKVSTEAINQRALAIIDSEGLEALTARRLAGDLRVSTRTLYKRIGSHDDLVKNIAALHLSRLITDVHADGPWDAVVTDWCMNLYLQMVAYPHATALLAHDDRIGLSPCLNQIADYAAGRGVRSDRARDLCRWTTQIAFNAAIAAVRPAPAGGDETVSFPTASEYAHDVRSSIEMIVSGEYSRESREASCT